MEDYWIIGVKASIIGLDYLDLHHFTFQMPILKIIKYYFQTNMLIMYFETRWWEHRQIYLILLKRDNQIAKMNI